MINPTVILNGTRVQHQDGRWGITIPQRSPFGLTVRVCGNRRVENWLFVDIVASSPSQLPEKISIVRMK